MSCAPRGGVLLLAGLAGLVAAGCSESNLLGSNNPQFQDPPSLEQGFLGYTPGSDRQPVCGNCHVGKSASWKQTEHASAFATLQASGHAGPTCEPCHTVGANGNSVSDTTVGWAANHDARFQDVQCESCHGPGLRHVTDPDAFQPLASITVSPTRACGECHQGDHNPFVEEWSQSHHGSMHASPQGNPDCVRCHEARGILAAWGVSTRYLEQDSAGVLPITCPVCHDPHDATNEGQLRFPIGVADTAVNLCMRCHQRRAVPDPTSSGGPHSPQGPLLLGSAGWRPPGFAQGTGPIVATHGTSANPRLCATCHVARLTVTDPATGAFVFQSTGHLFQAIPCLDARGVPTLDDCDLAQRTFAACTGSGCHGSQDAARTAMTVAEARIGALVDALNALLAQVPASEFDASDDHVTTAEGAKFNARLGAMEGSPVHNPFLMESLLIASIQQVTQDYGLVAPAGLSLRSVLEAR